MIIDFAIAKVGLEITKSVWEIAKVSLETSKVELAIAEVKIELSRVGDSQAAVLIWHRTVALSPSPSAIYPTTRTRRILIGTTLAAPTGN
jgi:hypothetical protein